MARRKPLKSVAHSVAHSFLSPLNYGPDGYAVENLVKAAVKKGIDTLHVDLLSGACDPKPTDRPTLRSIETYVSGFPGLVLKSGSDMKFVRSATMTLSGLNEPLQTHWLPTRFSYRVACTIEIISDENRQYSATLAEMWPGPPPRPRSIFKRRVA